MCGSPIDLVISDFVAIGLTVAIIFASVCAGNLRSLICMDFVSYM